MTPSDAMRRMLAAVRTTLVGAYSFGLFQVPSKQGTSASSRTPRPVERVGARFRLAVQ